MAGRSWIATSALSYLIVFLSINPIWSLASEKVQVSLYYETLCLPCADFIVKQVTKIFQNGLISAVDLRLVPWGNSRRLPNGTFVCQHGEYECFLNTLEACTITEYPIVYQHFNFIPCVERLTMTGQHRLRFLCVNDTKIGRAPFDCYNRGYGNQIEDKFASETANLKPTHTFVPWVVVNNQPLLEDFQNFMVYICKAYKGSPKPEACQSLPYEIDSTGKKNATIEVCHNGEARNFTSLGLEF